MRLLAGGAERECRSTHARAWLGILSRPAGVGGMTRERAEDTAFSLSRLSSDEMRLLR